MPVIRSPRGATHAYALGSYYEAFWMRVGRQVFAFNLYRNEWLLTNHKPSFLASFKPLNVFEMHPDTATSRRQFQEQH
ncbi:hypothetical protein [Pseudomonas alabamensis]|uniref:hypothetical protein n=1 Tax=Pseudomonas alabamensis TaxID=3064349 RepID=UPI000AB7532B